MIEILEEYNELLKLNYTENTKFQYFLMKSDLEFRLDELNLCKESLEIAINNIKFNEEGLLILFKLATVCSKWNKVFMMLSKYQLQFENSEISNKYIENIFKIYKYILNKEKMTKQSMSNIINECSNNIEKSVCSYLFSLLTYESKNEIKHCNSAILFWKDNLAAWEILYKNNVIVSAEVISKLLAMDMVQNIVLESDYNKLNFEFIPLGGGNDIGASCYYIKIDDLNIIVDAGIKFKDGNYEYPNFNLLKDIGVIKDINYVVITHAHLDHCGAILELYKLNKSIKLILTKETRELLKLNLKSLNLIEINELERLLQRSIILNFNRILNLSKENVSIELYRAGHILGAASIMIRSKSCKVFITGDFSLRNQNTVLGMNLPKERIDILITENTYGNKDKYISPKREYLEMSKYIRDKINEGKKILIPAFALGRTQEVIDIINSDNKNNRFRVYIDGSSVEATKIYEKFIDKRLYKKNVYEVDDSFYLSKEDFIKQEIMSNTCCIVSSSGMIIEGSASCEYIKQILPSKEGVCILTGYQANDTIGKKLKEQMKLNCDKYINIEGKCYKIFSEVKEFKLSAHSNIDEILAVQLVLRAKHVILMHGEYKGKETLIEKRLKNIKNINVYQSENNKKISI